MEEGFEVRWVQQVNKKGEVGGLGYFQLSLKYQKRNGLGIRRRMQNRQVEREQAKKEGREKSLFNKYEVKIINTLYSFQTPLTTGKVAKYADFSYNTVRKYLRRLAEKEYVKSTHHGNAVYWWLREAE